MFRRDDRQQDNMKVRENGMIAFLAGFIVGGGFGFIIAGLMISSSESDRQREREEVNECEERKSIY